MSSTNLVPNKALLKAGVATALLAAAGPALAQEQANTAAVDTIIVTGSRIARPELQASSPVAVIGAEELKLSGTVNVEETLYDLPQVIPSLSAASNNPGEGVATVDLRALGATRTLVLVNGRRYVSYDEQQIVDLNTVPAGLIERVDVVTGGRSAVYGSDAIAGVVNFVLKKDFEGVQVSGNYRLTEKGDADTYSFDGMIGSNFADGKGNVTAYMNYAKRKPLLQSARGYSRNAIADNGDGTTYFGGSSAILGTRYAIGNFGANPASEIISSTGNRRYESGGDSVPYNPTTDAYNYAPDNYLQTPQERWFIGAMANYEVNEHLEVFSEAQFVNSRVNSQLAATPVTGNFRIGVNNPFLSAAERARFAAIDASELTVRRDADGNAVLDADENILGDPAATRGDGYVTAAIGRRFAETGPRFQLDDRSAYRMLTGLRGDIAGGWTYEGYYSYAHNRNTQTQEGNVSVSRFQNALDVEVLGDGTIRCRSADARAAGCAPLNIFGENTASAEAVDYVTVPTTNINTITSQVASFVVSNGELFDLGAGPAGIALGAEWRSEAGSYRPDFYLASGDIVGFNAGQPTKGRYSVKELFGEVALPLLADQPFAHNLEFTGALRYADYSNAVGSAWSYSAGLMWAPVEDVSFRGQYQRAVRAPTISQLFLGNSVGFPGALDPCEQPVALSNATLNATCRAQGVPANLIGTEFAGGDSQIQSLFGGNVDLQEEKADTYTIGAVIQPSFLPRFTLTVDYYNITIKDYIGGSGPGTANIIAACYGDGNSDFVPYDSSFCALAPRNPNDLSLEDVVSINANLGKMKTSGVDFEARYWFNVPVGIENDGRLDFRLSGTRLIKWELAPIASASGLVNDCTGRFGNTCGDPLSKWRWSARVNYSTGPFTTSLLWYHLGGAKDDDDGLLYWREKVGSYDLFNLSFAYEVSENLDIGIGIDNVFNKKPPLFGDNQQQANTFPSTYDPFGRRYFFSATAKF